MKNKVIFNKQGIKVIQEYSLISNDLVYKVITPFDFVYFRERSKAISKAVELIEDLR